MTRPARHLESLEAAHRILAGLGIQHGLIGGWAAIAWGRVRATRDIDWLAFIPAARRASVLGAFSAMGSAEWRTPGEDDPIAGLVRVVPEDPELPLIDILLARGAADMDALSRCVPIDLGHGPVPTVRPEDIIAMKLQAGGGLDYEDVRALLSAQGDKIDEPLLQDSCKRRRVGDRLALLRQPRKA